MRITPRQCPLPLVFAGIVMAFPAFAERSVVSGQFQQGDPSAPFLNQPLCESGEQGPYQVLGPVRASVGGDYAVQDAGNTQLFSQDSVVTFFDAAPDPQNLEANQVMTVDDNGTVALQAGTDYWLFVQPCGPLDAAVNGVWGQHFNGPGTVSGPQTIAAPEHWGGEWESGGPQVNANPDPTCPATYFDETGPLRFDRTGFHFVSPTSGYDGQFLNLYVYIAPFDPQNPSANQVADVEVGPLFLQKDTDYWFVVQPKCEVNTGPWYYVLWPPTFALNSGLSGTYANLETLGQGILFDADSTTGFVFGAWFTFASANEAGDSVPEAVGATGQRWLTMDGSFERGDDSVALTLNSTSGGIFDEPPPAGQDTVPVGTATLTMDDCQTGELSYALDSGEEGSTTLTRLIDGNTRHCYELAAAPGVLYE